MEEPNFQEEKKLWKKGFKRVACLDESGRGPLAGPVVAAAVMINRRSDLLIKWRSDLRYIKDSKKLSRKKREKLYKLLIKNSNIEWGIGRVSEKMIDRINILEATKLAMVKSLKNLEKRSIIKTHDRRNLCKVDFLILDGNFKINLPIPQKSIIKADEKVFACAAASILAKVWRDRLMMYYHKKYPRFRFDLHKGYPTKLHRKLLKKYGPCKIHRKSFTLLKRIN